MKAYYESIQDLMATIEAKWQTANFDAEAFPEIVWEKTTNFDLSPLGEVSNQMRLLELAGVRQQQHRSTFSDLHFQIFHNGRFMIEILNWWGQHVNVHDHDFSAVQFQLKGDALNVEYEFTSEETHGALHFGRLLPKHAEVWEEGGRSIVRPGRVAPHGVFHIGEPTTSLLIRTTPTPRYGAQLNYFPGLAAHYYVSNDIHRKKLTGLGLLARSSRAKFSETLNRFLASQSLSENFFMLIKLAPFLFTAENSDLICNYAEKGPNERRIVENVAFNTAIDFFKQLATETEGLTPSEKLAAYVLSAGHSREAQEKILADLQKKDKAVSFAEDLRSILKKVSAEQRSQAEGYMELLGVGTTGVANIA